MMEKNLFNNLLIWLNRNHPIIMNYFFIIDPANFVKLFEYHNMPVKCYYFANDKRGTRNFEYFPIAELQHLIYDKKYFNIEKDIKNKTMNFFWLGIIFQEKGDKIKMWDYYFNDLYLEKSSLWIPLRVNGVFVNKKQEISKYGRNSKEKLLKLFPELVKKILNHPLYKGHLLPNQITKEIVKYKYSLIVRCVSIEDSLNYRPIQYAYLRILPFLDPQYDPCYLQYPKEIQEKLVVENSKDIEKKIKYYEKNPQEREKLLDYLEEHFRIKEFENNWENEIKKYFNH